MSDKLPPGVTDSHPNFRANNKDPDDYCRDCDSNPCRCDHAYEQMRDRKAEEAMQRADR